MKSEADANIGREAQVILLTKYILKYSPFLKNLLIFTYLALQYYNIKIIYSV